MTKERVYGLVEWTITAPIKGEATCTLRLPVGSTKYDAYRAVFNGGADVKWLEEWGFNEDPQSGDYVIAHGPDCDGEEVELDEEHAEPDEEDEE